MAEQPNKDPVADTVASQVLAKSVIFLSDSQNILLGIFVAKQHFWIAVSGWINKRGLIPTIPLFLSLLFHLEIFFLTEWNELFLSGLMRRLLLYWSLLQPMEQTCKHFLGYNPPLINDMLFESFHKLSLANI